MWEMYSNKVARQCGRTFNQQSVGLDGTCLRLLPLLQSKLALLHRKLALEDLDAPLILLAIRLESSEACIPVRAFKSAEPL